MFCFSTARSISISLLKKKILNGGSLASKRADVVDFVITLFIVIMFLAVADISPRELDMAITLGDVMAQGGFHGSKIGVMVDNIGIGSFGVVDGD